MVILSNQAYMIRVLVIISVTLWINAVEANGAIKVDQLLLVGDSLGDVNNLYDTTSYVSGVSDEEPVFFPEHYRRVRSWTCGMVGKFLKPLPGEPYHNKRFSNGEIASDHVTKLVGLDTANNDQFVNMAFGGSMVRSLSGSFYDWVYSWCDWHECSFRDVFNNMKTGKSWLVPSMLEMATYYVNNIESTHLDENKCILAFVGNGGSDFINRARSAEVVLSEQIKVVKKLINEAKLKHICWGTVPNPARSLCFSGETQDVIELKKTINRRVTEYNRLVRDEFSKLAKKRDDVTFVFLDGEAIFGFLIDNAEAFGFTQMGQAYTNITFGDCVHCSGQINLRGMHKNSVQYRGSNPDEFFYFDPIHPTAKVHRLISVLIGFSLLNKNYKIDTGYLSDLLNNSMVSGNEKLFVEFFEAQKILDEKSILEFFQR